MLGWLLWLYDMVNNLSAVHLHAALAHADDIFRVERVLHLDPEIALNTWIGAHQLVGFVLSNFYDNAHFVVTIGLLAWLWWRHPPIYRPLRNALVLINVIGFAVFWLYPVAPPRMLQSAGFVDVVALTHSWARGTAGRWPPKPTSWRPCRHCTWPGLFGAASSCG